MSIFKLNNSMFMQPKYLPPSSWTAHLPFAFWLIEEHKPKVLVELGTHAGASYMGFCQSVLENRTDTKCFAVDTWQGDEHAGYYGDDLYNTLKQHHDNEYAGFSQLLRMTFDDALGCFEDKSVDLLHIDGLHTYEAVSHDFKTWLPKMSEHGVIIFHDIMVRERNFGVWRLWHELNKKYPSFEFKHEHGLGVLIIGKNISKNILELCEQNSTEDRASTCRLFDTLGSKIKNNEQRAHFERLVVIRERSLLEIESKLATQVSIVNSSELQLKSQQEKTEQLANTLANLEQKIHNEIAEKLELISHHKHMQEQSKKEIQNLSSDFERKIASLSTALDSCQKETLSLKTKLDASEVRTNSYLNQISSLEESLKTSRIFITEIQKDFSEKTKHSQLVIELQSAKITAETDANAEAAKKFKQELSQQAKQARMEIDNLNMKIKKEAGSYTKMLAEQDIELELKKAEIDYMKTSKSWRITKLLRWFEQRTL
jgi:Methyltransferase domain